MCKIQTENTNFFFPSLSIEINQTEGLYCFTCYVTTSWEDCYKNGSVKQCSEEDNDVCVTMKLDKWDNGRHVTEYVKHCSVASYCSDDECQESGYKCIVQCCNYDVCNTSNTILANIILVIVISCLQTVLH